MKEQFFLWFLILLSTTLVAQNKMSATLKNDINEHPKTWQTILVIGTERVDGYQYEKENRAQYATRSEFTVAFLKDLKKQNINENKWLDELEYEGLDFEIVHKFWSVNIVAIKASPKTIQYLNDLPEIYWMEETSERIIEWVKPIEMTPNHQKLPNGKEQGIVAVKGDSLWMLGYTGKGSKLLTFDTGVWPNHPAFRDQFLGNHAPLDLSWFGYDTYWPGDKSGSHGTHVTGTCLGLDPLNSDTIGLAFNAYFMATDPIVQSVADIKTAFELMMGYEWALNPDGNINTTDDMPDVINNSWGRPYSSDDSAVCDGWVNDLFVNVEIAGIVSIHSAGNEGPGVGTIGYPAVSNASVVNNFSIGAVNGNSPSFPIAGFSSRGPTVCGDTGTLLIKPEVVAPGVNVRSSIKDANGDYTYANISGTSMAAPHVSGVSLLLTEAFPEASATEIKEALFYTAKDLGVVGEDNDYGNGMIDAIAAYHYLSVLYSPSIPSNSGFDIHLTDFSIDEYSSNCHVNSITAYFSNTQDVPNSTLQFEYGIYGETPLYHSSNSGTFFINDSVTLPIQNMVHQGWNEFYVRTVYTGQLEDHDTINNTRFIRFWLSGEQSLPYLENFDSVSAFQSSMFVGNPDLATTWDTATVIGINRVSNSAMMQFSRYSPRSYQHDYLETPNFKIAPTSSLTLSFDLSYQVKFNGFKDSLMVFVSADCGETWGSPVYAKGPDSLSTTNKPLNGNWTPIDPSDWRTEMVDLSAFKNETNIMVRIETANGNGNNLYLDNINIYDDNGVVGINEKEVDEFVMYPNPVRDGVLNFNTTISGKIISISGVQVMKFEHSNRINVSDFQSGVYLVTDDKTNRVYKLIIQ